ncbi:hypothetical protein FE810_15415 [Thalassotalea litorea]|uniref:Uncharacterized protein n=1 Tax=Thalassotalea litorea TaxID=2020715 RepID=A0A5R9IMJ4_9GAMM|nr:hypothetical protein [Thalassotalea litorea]TLU61209.1 hypothetical protein FE810_15415 [Thalassotalea litorea]
MAKILSELTPGLFKQTLRTHAVDFSGHALCDENLNQFSKNTKLNVGHISCSDCVDIIRASFMVSHEELAPEHDFSELPPGNCH